VSWTELLDRVGGELKEDLVKIRREGSEKKNKIIGDAVARAEKKIMEGREQSEKQAKMLFEEISSSGRIRAKGVIRKSKTDALNEIYEEFKRKILADDELKKKILEKFLEENVCAGCEVQVTPDVFALFKKNKKFKPVKNADCPSPVLILRDRVTISFDWDEFMAGLKERTIGRVK